MGQLNSSGATLVRICGATLSAMVKLNKGSVVLGDGTSECAVNTFDNAVVLKASASSIEIAGPPRSRTPAMARSPWKKTAGKYP